MLRCRETNAMWAQAFSKPRRIIKTVAIKVKGQNFNIKYQGV